MRSSLLVLGLLSVLNSGRAVAAMGDAFSFVTTGSGNLNADLSTAYLLNPATLGGNWFDRSFYFGGSSVPGLHAGMYLGFDVLAFQAGASYLLNNSLLAYGGSIVGYIRGADLSIGVSTSETAQNIGINVGKNRRFKLALAVSDFLRASRSYRSGVGFELGKIAVLSVDVNTASFSDFNIVPSLLIGTPVVAGTVSYGLNLGAGAPLGFTGVNLGLSVSLNIVAFRAYYSGGGAIATVLLPFPI